MSIDVITEYINSYGYIILFICLFFGIVGIPAPEESLLFLTGILISHHHLAMGSALVYSELGAFIGMLTAYYFGKYLGKPFIDRFGRHIGLTKEKWSVIENRYKANARKAITFGFYLPGVRQISPYFAGIAHFPFRQFFLFSLIGSVIWTIPIILAGYYTARVIYINPKYVPYLGVFLFVLYLVHLLWKKIIYKNKRKQK
ncbi:DedA family protein [Rummeliibacillus sp. POC4]|uniref:DedA family protein n=1 Tax=Rummeliibacillus sp. POC4 TaxID=2305899 RepID=UPI000E66612A|nr:DedA family protein [Rummeliibacillus sp. POC4]RIJ66665.1 DedA family protein [Rummeliibacillus sp. POC4]